MSAADRICWILSEVSRGRSISASFSFNEVTGREKVKFVIQDSYSFKDVYRPCLLGAISSVRQAVVYSVVTDKGHHSGSKSASTIEFWLKQPPAHDIPVPSDETGIVQQLATSQAPSPQSAPCLVPSIDDNSEALCDSSPNDEEYKFICNMFPDAVSNFSSDSAEKSMPADDESKRDSLQSQFREMGSCVHATLAKCDAMRDHVSFAMGFHPDSELGLGLIAETTSLRMEFGSPLRGDLSQVATNLGQRLDNMQYLFQRITEYYDAAIEIVARLAEEDEMKNGT